MTHFCMFVQAGFMHLQYVISVCFCPCHVVFAYNYSIIRTIKTKKYYCFLRPGLNLIHFFNQVYFTGKKHQL